MSWEIRTRGAHLVTEGRSGYSLFVIATGTASVIHDDQALRTLGSGDFFDEIAILGKGRRTATVTASDEVTAWELSGTAFRELDARPARRRRRAHPGHAGPPRRW